MEEQNVVHCINYARCHHTIFYFLKKRCEQRYLTFLQNKIDPNNFEIHSPHAKYALKFVRNPLTKNFAVNDILYLSNENLLGLNDPTLLFDLMECLIDIRNTYEIIIENNEIKTLDAYQEAILSSRDITNLDEIYNNHRFSIQLMSKNMLAINQCIKIPLFLFKTLINNKEVKEKFFSLATHYLKAFQMAPICCKMQALTHFTTTGYRNLFSTLYLKHHKDVFLKIVNLLYPYIHELEDNDLIRQYLEVMPVALMELRNASAVLSPLEQLKNQNISIEFLRTGRIIRLDNFYDIHHQLLLELKNVKYFVKSLRILHDLDKIYNLYKAADLCVHENTNYMEPIKHDQMEILEIPDKYGKEVLIYPPREINYFPECLKCKWSLSKSRIALLGRLPFAMVGESFMQCWENASTRKKLKLAIKYSKQCPFFFDSLFGDFQESFVSKIDNSEHCFRQDSFNSELIIVNERLHFQKKEFFATVKKYHDLYYQNSEKTESNKYKEFVDIFTKLQNNEGLCFYFEVDTVTFAPLYTYDTNDGYKRSLLCKDYIAQIFPVLQNLLSENESFEIMEDGTISINQKFKFHPFILMSIKDRRSFINAILKLSETPIGGVFKKMNEPLVSIGTEAMDEFARKEYKMDKRFWKTRKELLPTFIQMARLLNNALNDVPDEYFLQKNFHSIPHMLFYEENVGKLKNACEMLKKLNENGIFISLLNDELVFEHFLSLKANSIFYLSNLQDIIEFCELLTAIKIEAGTQIIFASDGRICVMKYIEGNAVMDDEVHYILSGEIKNDLQKCFTLLRTLPENRANFSIAVNGIILFRPYLSILPCHFLNIPEGYHLILFDAINLYNKIFQNIRKTYNCWQNWNKEVDNFFVKNGGNSFIRNKEKIFLQIIKLLQPNLQFITEDELTTNRNLALLTQHLMIKEPERLLERLLKLKDIGCDVTVLKGGTLAINHIEFSVKQLLAMTEDDCFELNEVNKYLAKISEGRPTQQLKYGANCFMLGADGFFLTMYDIAPRENADYLLTDDLETSNKKFFACSIIAFERKLSESNLNLPLIINSNGAMMIGNFVWAFVDSFLLTANNCNQICKNFIEALNANNEMLLNRDQIKPGFSHYDYETHLHKYFKIETKIFDYILKIETIQKPLKKEMKSVYDLQEFEKAVEIADLINPFLKYFPLSLFKSKLIRIFPTFLWEAWNKNPTQTYQKVKDIFTKFNEKKIKWLLKLNGNFEVENYLVITMEQIMKIKNFEKFLAFLIFLKNEWEEQLICKEDGEYENIEVYKMLNSKVDLEKIVDAKTEAQKLKCNQNSIASNGALLFNRNIWIKPEIFLRDKEKFKRMTEIITEIFGENICFKYGKWDDEIIPAISKNFVEELYEYCRNFCDVVQIISPTSTIKYDENQQQFNFNDCLLISPYAFFDLKDIDKFVKELQAFSNPDKRIEDKENEFIEAYLNTNSSLSTIAGKERLEYIFIRHYCLRQIGKIFYANTNFLSTFLPDIQITDDETTFYNIENILINDKYIFKEGVLKHFLNIKEKKLNINDKVFLVALKIANEIDDKFKCRNLFDYTSIVEIVNEYCKGRNIVNGRIECFKDNPTSEILIKDDNEYQKLLDLINEQLKLIKVQQKFWKFKFANELKGLHHWIKHGENSNSLQHYYEKMNQFFKNPGTYKLQAYTQNGLKFTRRYEKDNYVGVIIIPRENEKMSCVTTFYYDGKIPEKYVKLNSNNLTENLVFSGISWSNYCGDPINEMIMIDDISKSKKLKNEMENMLTRKDYSNPEKVKKILILLPDTFNDEDFIRKWENKKSLPKSRFPVAEFIIKKLSMNSDINLKQFIEDIFQVE